MSRPFINFLAKDLIAEIELSKCNPERLRLLFEEMSRRKKAARQLGPYIEQVQQMLEEGSINASPDIPAEQAAPLEQEPPIDSHTTTSPEIRVTSDTKDIKVPIELIIEEEKFSFKPSFLNRLLGGGVMDASLKSPSLILRHKGQENTVDLASIFNIDMRKGFIFADLSFQSNGKTIYFSRLSKHQASMLKDWLSLAPRIPEIVKVIREFHSLFNLDSYLNRKRLDAWRISLGDIPELLYRRNSTQEYLDKNSKGLLSLLHTAEEQVKAYNDRFVEREAEAWKEFFSRLEANPLTSSQIEAILRDEDATLVVAGAGTGKTSTVVGKVGYLLSKGICKPDEVLALAFGKDAAAEMRERVKNKTGFDVQIRTFHSLGLNIMQDRAGLRLKISDVAIHERALMALIANILREMTEDDRSRPLIQNFISFHRYPAKYLEDFDSNGDYLKYLRKYEPVTLRGELVKSFEELLIADWLTLNGIRYSYEYPYEHETASRQRGQYRPDFYLVDYGLYLEHFGIDRNGRTAPGIDQKKYNEGIQWKRELHAKCGTTMIETYSWERKEGKILDLLKEKLEDTGIQLQPASKELIQELLETRDINKKLVSLTKDFLGVFKEGQWSINEVRQGLNRLSTNDRTRAESFLELFQEVHVRYEHYLSSRQELDFADLIRESTRILNEGKAKIAFKRIIVDEYQDISRGRYRFLKSILEQDPECRIMCVGDDWQSIYGFTGSDVSMTTNFESLFGYAARVDLDRTFRFTTPILESSARFIQENPIQLKKRISARPPSLPNSIEILAKTPTNTELTFKDVLVSIDKARPPSKKWRVLVLGRYKFIKPEEFDDVCGDFPSLSVEYMTIHKSKGLEADAVAVLGLTDAKFGFPGTIETDPLMSLIIPGEDAFDNAEERRVLYVAMTRAKEYLLLCTDSTAPSCFIEELADGTRYPEIHSLAIDPDLLSLYACPDCSGRLWLKYPNKKQGYAWACNLSPYCSYTARSCQLCRHYPMTRSGICANPQCKKEAR